MTSSIPFIDTENSINHVEIRQRFTLPDNFALGEDPDLFTPRDPIVTQVLPSLIGFGFLARIDPISENTGEVDTAALDAVAFDWALVDRSGGDDNIIRTGTYTQAVNMGKCWIDVFFDPRNPVPTQVDGRYEFRIGQPKAQNPAPFNNVYMQLPAPITASVSPISDNDIFLKDASDISEYVNHALIYRVWADIGESGEDVLGNEYREGIRRDEVANVTDNNAQTSWISQPNPAPTAVEALYFDVRYTDPDTNALLPSIIDSVRVDPYLTGSYMHVYYSTEGVTVTGTPARAPQTLDNWDQLLWTHVQQSYVLNKNQIYNLPRPIRAAWIKLEFSNLQPVPFAQTDFPLLPAVTYREFPRAVSDSFVSPSREGAGQKNTEDHFIQSKTTVQDNIFNAYQPDRADIDYPTRYSSTPVTDPSSNIFATPGTSSAIDPVTLGRIYYSSSQTNYGPNLATQMNPNTVLGNRQQQIAVNSMSTKPFEVINTASRTTNQVSNLNDRTTEVIAVPDMYFVEPCRHVYKQMKARFNGKAYAVGVRDVQFLRNDFTTLKDDVTIHDSLADPNPDGSPLVLVNNWVPQPSTNIPLGTTCYLTYDVDYGNAEGVLHTVDEIVQFEDPDATDFNFTAIPLANGGAQATNAQLWDGVGMTGNFYVAGVDYTLVFDSESFTNSIARNELHFRLTAT